MSPVRFQSVCKAYGENVVLNDISLEFPANCTTAVIGPSGSGKSTLLQSINGLVKADSGHIFLFGEGIDYGDLANLRLKIGYAVQGTGLFPHMSVERNITLLARLGKWPRERLQERLDTLMQLVELPLSYRDKYPYMLSGGEQQRVGLCRAMMLDPRLFLLDEPFGALDPITRSGIHDEFIKIQKLSPRTTILVTHDLREAVKLADNMIILNQGRLVQCGTPDAILANPADGFVERFVSEQLR